MSRCTVCGEHDLTSTCLEWEKAHWQLSQIGTGIDDLRRGMDDLCDVTDKGFGELSQATREGFGRVEKGLSSVRSALGSLESSMVWGFQLLASQVGEVVSRLEDISFALRNPDRVRMQSRVLEGIAALCQAEPEHLVEVAGASQQLFERAEHDLPTEWEPKIFLGLSFLLQGRLDEAADSFDESRAFTRRQPGLRAITWRLLAWARYCQDDLTAAIEAARQGVKTSDDPMCHYDLAHYCCLAGHTQDARVHLEAAVRKKPSLFAVANRERCFDTV